MRRDVDGGGRGGGRLKENGGREEERNQEERKGSEDRGSKAIVRIVVGPVGGLSIRSPLR